MTVNLETLGDIDDRWQPESRFASSLSPETQDFIRLGIKRIYDSRRLAEINNARSPEHVLDLNPPLDDDDWNAVSFMLAVGAEVRQDSDPGHIRISLSSNGSEEKLASTVEFEVASGTESRKIEPFTASDDTDYFRNLVALLESAYGVPDHLLTVPGAPWHRFATVVDGWRIRLEEDEAGKSLLIEKS